MVLIPESFERAGRIAGVEGSLGSEAVSHQLHVMSLTTPEGPVTIRVGTWEPGRGSFKRTNAGESD